jgi:hypothetical protein
MSSFGLITTQTPISGVASGAIAVVPVPIAAFADEMKEKSKPIARPVAIALDPTIKWRREALVALVVFVLIVFVMIAPYALLTA